MFPTPLGPSLFTVPTVGVGMAHGRHHDTNESIDGADDRETADASLDESTGNLDLTRRTLLKTTGAAAGAGLFGLGATGSAAAASGVNQDFVNWRVREASKIWKRGYRGRPDRSISLTDSGLSPRHPDEGPWNGITALIRDGEVKLTRPAQNDTERVKTGETESFSGTAGPGTFATGEEFYHEFTTPSGVEELDATLSWSPSEPANDLEFGLDKKVDGEYERVVTAATASEPETFSVAVEPDHQYRFVGEHYLNVTSTYEISGTYFAIQGDVTFVDDSEAFDFAGADGDVTADTPKTIGWYDAGSRYGSFEKPRDGDGHGSHVTGIMGASGRGSAIDPDTVHEEEPRAILAAGDVLSYEVDAAAGRGIYGSAYGELIELAIEGPDGRQLDRSDFQKGDATAADDSSYDGSNVVVETPTTHESGTGTYTVYVRPLSGETTSAGRVSRVSVGAFRDPASTTGDRTAGDGPSLHTGVAPNASLVGLQGLSGPTEDLGDHAEDFARIFNIRAVNMSWGYVGGLPLGAFGGTIGSIPEAIKQIAEGGILTCAAAGNSNTPANGNGAPAVADECISVVATDPLDGIVDYSSGGLGGLDEDDGGVYMKPDVTAPGGSSTDLVNATKRGDPNTPESEQDPIRDYVEKAGTSMASPFTTGTSGLVAEAMEFDAPGEIALPEPAAAGIEDVYRLKQVLLATASETAFTAAPFHDAHFPTYEFGGRDPYEGFGRLNGDAAVDAVTQEFSGTSSETMGLNLPEDSRAVAGYVRAGPGTLSVDVEFSHYSGGNKGATKGEPHVDVFVYDAASPAENGEPNVVASGQGLEGSPSASASFGRDAAESVYYVVAKLVNVPGVFNGYDVQAHFDLSVGFEPGIFVSGTREDDGSVFTAGQTNQVDLTVNTSEAGPVRDAVPTEWDVLTEFSDDVERVEQGDGVMYVYFGETAAADTQTEYTYLVETPEEGSAVSDTGRYSFGPIEVLIDEEWVAAAGTSETNTVVGLSTNV